MEADIILEGFHLSIEMYGAIYGTILADGDSNVYCKLLESRPYSNLTVDKIECTNHLLRNYCTKMREIVVDKNAGPIQLRKAVGSNILRMRTAVSKAAQHRKQQSDTQFSEKVQLLKKDLLNSVSHIYGEHLKCKELKYFCNGSKDGDKNLIPQMKESGIYQKMMRHVSYLTDHARSLLLNQNNNPVEHFNSIVAKFIGGKRVNYTQKRSYKSRCSAAVVSLNTRVPLYTLHKTMYKKSPGKVLKTQQKKRADKIAKAALRRKTNPRKRSKIVVSQKERNENNRSYGRLAQKPDMRPDLYDEKKKTSYLAYVGMKMKGRQ